MTFDLPPEAMRKKKKARWTEAPSHPSPCPSSASFVVAAGGGGDGAGAGGDYLTNLPDALRLEILCLLPLKFAIRTGVLSSRWRDFWKDRWPEPSSLDLSAADGELPEDFVDRVDRCIRRRGRRPIDALRIVFHPGLRHSHDVSRWLEYAAACGVGDLHVDVSPPPPPPSTSSRRRPPRRRYGPSAFHFLYLGYESRNLARLTLCGFHLSSSTSHFKRLSSLEVLCIHDASITEAALRKIIATCPQLRSLDLRCCRDLRRISIPASQRFTSLTIVDCPKASKLTVSAAALRSFRFSGSYLTSYCLDNSFALEDVYMNSGGLGSGLPQSNWVNAIGGLPNVRVLTLCSLSLQYITVSGANAIVEFRNFRNLRELQVLMGMMTDSNLTDFYGFFRLCRCPSLERLFIELPTNMYDPFMHKFLEVIEEEPPEVAFENLKVIKINNFKGHYNEMQLVKFLLERASNLETLAVVAFQEFTTNGVDNCSGMLQFLHEQLSLLTRASVNAKIVLSEHDNNKLRPTHSEVYIKV